MLSHQGLKRQWRPTTGLRQSGELWPTTTRATGQPRPPYVGPSLQFSLDPDIWATTGVALNIFAANLIRTQSPWRYSFAFTCAVGSYDGTSWNYTPVDADAGDHALTVQLFDARTGALLGTQTSTVHVTAQASPARAQPLRVILMGDSVTDFDLYPPAWAALMNGVGNPSYAMFGTKVGTTTGGHAVRHEGASGKTWQWFFKNTPHDPNVNSPLAPTGTVDIPSYIATVCGGAVPDLWTIELGINDTFGAAPYDDALIQTSINTMLTNADALIAAIQLTCPTTDIGILTTTPGGSSETGFFFDYSGAFTSWGWTRIQRYLVTQQIAHWAGKQAQKIWLLPSHAVLDTNSDFPLTTQGVHPLAGLGMQRVANTIYAWAKARMAVR